MKIGILGGAFDPIHAGHIAVAEAAIARLGLDEVLVMPSGSPPYKRCRADREDRMRMVRLACAGRPGLVPCDIEIRRPGDTYTADTLRALAAEHPGDALVYILGLDALDALGRWRDIGDIARETTFAVAGRPGWDREAADKKARALEASDGLKIEITDIEGMGVSSAMVRERIAVGEPVEDILPDGVAAYIREQGLYLCDYSEAEILERLRRTITLHRYHHTLGVADTAERLAANCGVSPKRARLAGLLHDCAKSMPYGEMRQLVQENVPDTDEAELDAEPVLHAPAGMVLARRDYGVKDPVILQAIRRHTLGGPDMTAMDALIYVSDFIEPGRRPFPGLEQVRAAAETDIFEALRLSARLSNNYLVSRGKTPHPKSQYLLNAQATGGDRS